MSSYRADDTSDKVIFFRSPFRVFVVVSFDIYELVFAHFNFFHSSFYYFL